jgi:O-glycosyl hydrolase
MLSDARRVNIWLRLALPVLVFVAYSITAKAATVIIDDLPAGQKQVIDGFGTCIGAAGDKDWFQRAYYDDMGCSIMRMDLSPAFKSPYSDRTYNSPWFSNPPPLKIDDPASPGGPEHNFVRTYTDAGNYTREFGGNRAQIAVMGPDIEKNIAFFDYDKSAAAGAMAKAGMARKDQLDDFKLYGSIWSPSPWVKIANGQKWGEHQGIMPATGTPYPFIWGGNFAGGKVDTSGAPLAIFDDGTGPTSALTQFARCTAAYVKGFQDKYGVKFYALSIQNELNFPEFYNSCVYATAPEYIAALKAVRKEFDQQPDLKDILIVGPEDLLGADPYSMWQLGAGPGATDKNLQYLTAIAKDAEAAGALGFFCIHGYANDGATAAGADSQSWRRWTDGWKESPALGIPADIAGFTSYHKRSWMTETSGEKTAWLEPESGFPGNGAWSVAFKMQQALTVGRESACLYWQFADGDGKATTIESLTQRQNTTEEPKYVAFKHFAKYIRPGAIVVSATVNDDHGITASAYVHSRNRTLTVVLVNRSHDAKATTITLPDDFSRVKTFHAVISSDGKLWQESDLNCVTGELNLTIPGYGVVTLFGQG